MRQPLALLFHCVWVLAPVRPDGFELSSWLCFLLYAICVSWLSVLSFAVSLTRSRSLSPLSLAHTDTQTLCLSVYVSLSLLSLSLSLSLSVSLRSLFTNFVLR